MNVNSLPTSIQNIIESLESFNRLTQKKNCVNLLNMDSLPLKLQGKLFTVGQARSLGLSFYELKKLVSTGFIEQVGRGLYRENIGDLSEEDQYRIATLRTGSPSVICMISALSFHQLTDTIPRKTWIMVPVGKRTRDRSLQVFRTRNPQWKIGIEKHDGYSVTNIERSVVECLVHRYRLGTTAGIEALRRAISSKKTTLGKIIDMAKKLEVEHRILPYLETLS